MMICLDDSRLSPPTTVLHAPGGFVWWYLEIFDADGSGVVLIWSFGLPFLPGYTSEARAGRPLSPRHHPSLNVVAYRQGHIACYSMHEFRPESAAWSGGDAWRFGASTIRQELGEREAAIVIYLDCPLVGTRERIDGHIRVQGPICRALDDGAFCGNEADDATGDTPASAGAQHWWTPVVAPAFGTARLRVGDERMIVSGRAYHARHWCTTHLDALGIGCWLWGHLAIPTGERLFYVLWPTAVPQRSEPLVIGLDIDRCGQMRMARDLEAVLPRSRRTFFGMPQWSRIELRQGGERWLDLMPTHRVDNGPFYLRYFATGTAATAEGPLTGHGACEVVLPARIDLARHRSLMRMQVASDTRPNSIWLPLFQGPRTRRFSRLLGQILAPERRPKPPHNNNHFP